ncbi:hypothetical protein JT358_11655 [Micrococcales bacterium 31B]|nr:hypothetical protein [Micrococcales bacterium 31B]
MHFETLTNRDSLINTGQVAHKVLEHSLDVLKNATMHQEGAALRARLEKQLPPDVWQLFCAAELEVARVVNFMHQALVASLTTGGESNLSVVDGSDSLVAFGNFVAAVAGTPSADILHQAVTETHDQGAIDVARAEPDPCVATLAIVLHVPAFFRAMQQDVDDFEAKRA